MKVKILLVILFIATIFAVSGAAVLVINQKPEETNEPPETEHSRSCIQSARDAGIPKDRYMLIPKVQNRSITRPEVIKLRETLRRAEIEQCEQLYDYLLRQRQ